MLLSILVYADKKVGVTVVWHYNAFLSYNVKPVEEKREWLDADAANMAQVDLNAFFLQNGMPTEDGSVEQLKLVESLYANAKNLWQENAEEKEGVLDRKV